LDTPVFKGRTLPWLFLLPSLVILAVFLYYPAVQTLRLSATSSNLITGNTRFVGWDNFLELVRDPSYLQSIGLTLLFGVLVVTLGLLSSLSLALLASSVRRGGRWYRLALIYPYALSPAIAGTLFLFLFNPEVGMVNAFLNDLFGIRPRWLDTPSLAFGLVVMAAVWKNVGYNVAFYIAAIQNLPKDVLEAARIDGASSFTLFWRIVFPLLSPMTFFLVFANLTYALFDSFGLVDILTRGGPVAGNGGATSFLIFRLYTDGIENYKTGFGAAQAVLMFFGVALITLAQFRFAGRRVQYGS